MTATSIKHNFKPEKWPKSNQRTRFKVGSVTFLLVFILTSTLSVQINASSYSSASPSSRFQLVSPLSSTQPSANLLKFGLIKGLKFVVKSSLDDNNNNRNNYNETELRLLFKKRNTVATFLGIPYAAPPTRSLRFMPPGAVKAQQHQQLAGQLEQCQLAQRTVQTRPFTEFGHECVRLSDWLENSAKKQSNNSDDNDLHLQQDENCLNLNVFVPLDQLNQIKTNDINDSPSSSSSSRHKTRFSVELNESLQPNKQDQLPMSGTNKLSDPPRGHQMKEDHLANQSVGCHLESITATKRDKLPVLVVFQSPPPTTTTTTTTNGNDKTTRSRANSLDYIQLAHLTQSIVVTFNHRIGLLGYLPFADADDHQTGNVRFNHAIWDQLGLLHWLRHNINNFNGDPANVTLMSADNQAAQSIQLLTMSPLAKGLFKRVFVVHNNNNDNQQPATTFNELVRLAQDSRQTTSKLFSELELIVRNQSQRPVFEHLKSANLSQLASIDLELSRNLPSKYLALVNQPNLEDRLLFPYFSSLFHSNKQASNLSAMDELIGAVNGGNSSATSIKSELNYCLYMRQLELKLASIGPETVQNITQLLVDFDPVGLIPRIYSNQVNSTVTGTTSSQQTNNLFASSEASLQVGQWRQDVRSMPVNAIRSRRATIAAEFHHLRHAQLLNSLLVKRLQQQQQQRQTQQQLDDEDEEDEAERKQQLRSMQILSSSAGESAMSNRLKRSKDDDYSTLVGAPHEEAQQLAELLGSVDLMLGFVAQPIRSHTRPGLQERHNNQQYSEIVKALNGLGSGRQLNEDLLALFKFADLHFVASLGTDESLFLSSQFCDFQSKQRFQPATKLIPISSLSTTRMFVLTDIGNKLEQDDNFGSFSWLLDSSYLLDSLSDFVRFGRQQHQSDELWPAYNTLNRNVKLISSEPIALTDQEQQLKQLVDIQMDLIPYLQQRQPSRAAAQIGGPQQQGNKQSQRLEPIELVSCLNDIEFALKSLPISTQQIGRPSPSPSNLSLSSLVRFNEEAQCLVNVTIHLRNQLRSISSLDLDLMVRRLNLVVASAGQSRQLALIERSSSGPSASGSLVNTTNGKAADDNDDNSDVDSTGSWQSPRTAPTTTSAANPGGSSTSWLSGKNLLARAYKDPVGQALSVIIGAGFFVFLINLLIVLIVLRSARRNRQRNGRVNDSNESGEPFGEDPMKADEPMLSTICTSSANSMGVQLADQQHLDNKQQHPLTSSFRTIQRAKISSSSSSPSCRPSKSIKFDLTGTNEHQTLEETTSLMASNHRLQVPPNAYNVDSQDDEDDSCGGFDLSQVNGSHRVALTADNRLVKLTTLNPNDLRLAANCDELMFQQQPVCQHHLQNSLASPFGSQSTSSSATIKSNHQNQTQSHHHHHQHHQHHHLNNQMVFIQPDGSSNLHSSIASPSSSTTLSTTPVPRPPSMLALNEHQSDHLIGLTFYQPLEQHLSKVEANQDNQLFLEGEMFAIQQQEPIYYLHQEEKRN